jgi:hypothetical protein
MYFKIFGVNIKKTELSISFVKLALILVLEVTV